MLPTMSLLFLVTFLLPFGSCTFAVLKSSVSWFRNGIAHFSVPIEALQIMPCSLIPPSPSHCRGELEAQKVNITGWEKIIYWKQEWNKKTNSNSNNVSPRGSGLCPLTRREPFPLTLEKHMRQYRISSRPWPSPILPGTRTPLNYKIIPRAFFQKKPFKCIISGYLNYSWPGKE